MHDPANRRSPAITLITPLSSFSLPNEKSRAKPEKTSYKAFPLASYRPIGAENSFDPAQS
ncbi:hypothetical protein CHL67_07715 [Prosthecochloris sp. GSB1]|uniref:hypothetical protein n=1 Tax=Prosthecochloris sp. GSB1 TaxID=281093 RepID=UPI000B8CA764|nr:hypothetical protein [Prosthecochloris sp. GSB1]ASQ90821.1 hypothetical protein CHL67_07715 [Prosthecochloris sp. GSB1]